MGVITQTYAKKYKIEINIMFSRLIAYKVFFIYY